MSIDQLAASDMKEQRSIENRVLLIAVVWIIVLAIAPCDAQTRQDRQNYQPIQIGKSNAPIQLEVFYDMQCISCPPFHSALKSALAKYPDKLRVTFHLFPLPLHDKGFQSALAVEAANRQGKGFEMIDILLSNSDEWAWTAKYKQKIDSYANSLGIDIQQFHDDINSSRTEGPVLMDIELEKQKKIGSVPSVFLNGRLLSYPEALELVDTAANLVDK